MACVADFKANLRNQLRLTEQAARDGAKIICTQELFGSQYFCQVEDHRFFKLAETILDERVLIAVIGNGKSRRKADARGFAPQNLHANRMKRRHGQSRGRAFARR